MSKLDINYTLEKFKSDIDEAILQAYLDGFIAGGAADKPTQAEFDSGHQEPLGYGEGGEMYVMAGNLTETQALYKLKIFFDKEMYDYGSVEELRNNIEFTKIAYTPEALSDEPSYYYDRDGRGIYDAWVWTA